MPLVENLKREARSSCLGTHPVAWSDRCATGAPGRGPVKRFSDVLEVCASIIVKSAAP